MSKTIDLTGQRFGRLTAINYEGGGRWSCECDCGNKRIIRGSELRRGRTHSCGCFRAETTAANKHTHGMTKERLYRTWASMKARCFNPTNRRYGDYGGRGITVCDEWRDSFEAFRDWALANGYRDDLTIDREDNDGPYSPENCRWSTHGEQANNKRNNRMLTHNGKTQTIAQWSKETGLAWTVIYDRLRNGWPVERVLTESVNTNDRKGK